ncbi:MAG: transposase family protein [bacterium]|nr:transposase family protein [bacterium]
MLKEQLGKKRLRLTDDQRHSLAAKGKILGRRLLSQVATIVTPDTILRWHQRLIAMKWTYPNGRVGRPGIMKKIRALIVRMATENSDCGYKRIQGELKNLDRSVARSTIAKTLKDNSIPPSANRATSWKTFLKAHADVIAAADFFNVQVWTARGLVTHHVLFVIHHTTRAVHIAGVTTNPDSAFILQVARNLTDHVDGFLRDKRYLIVDNACVFTAEFERILADAGVKLVRTAIQAPDMNAIAERWVRSIKTECLNKIIPFGFTSLERSVNESVTHYNLERPHQGVGNELIAGSKDSGNGEVIVSERLGGLLKHYHRAAA